MPLDTSDLRAKLIDEVLMRRPRRAAAELPRARFLGRRWIVAMCEHEWSVFQHAIAPGANERLTAILDSFCEDGEADVPPSAFRWFAPADGDPIGVEIGAFEAKGVVLQGRRACVEGRDAFFVTSISVDAQPPQPEGRRSRRVPDERQRLLPLEQPCTGSGFNDTEQ